jgi:hypothetical protein
MRNSGKINILTIGVVAMVGLFSAAFLLAKEDAQSSGAKFMDALARHDVDRLVELSYIGETDPAKIEETKKKLKEDWDFCVNKAGKHFLFTWKISASSKSSPTQATVALKINRAPAGGSGYDEKFELPMELEGGQWKVDVGGINAEMFPALPRI